jgi:hypothetical protein
MPKLETQINQIYLTHPQATSNTLVMFQEPLDESQNLLVIAKLINIRKKSDTVDLKKICSCIQKIFKNNINLSGEHLFEAALSEINNTLAEFGQKERKAWIGKLSAIICLQSNDSVYLSSSGQTCSWLFRKKELTEILHPEPSVEKPIKTFSNFTSGKIRSQDILLVSTSNIFNYISLQLLGKTLFESNSEQASVEISKIIQDSSENEDSIGTYLINCGEGLSQTEESMPIYAPIPEEISIEKKPGYSLVHKLVNILDFKKFHFFQKRPKQIPLLSKPRFSLAKKFFLISFSLFFILALINFSKYAIQNHKIKTQKEIVSLEQSLETEIYDIEFALLYKNQNQAVKIYDEYLLNLKRMEDLKGPKTEFYKQSQAELYNRINLINTVLEPKVAAEFRLSADLLTRAGNGFFLAQKQSKTFFKYNPNISELFMINTPQTPLEGAAHVSGTGTFAVFGDTIYLIDESQKQYVALKTIPGASLLGLKFMEPNRLYSFNKTTGELLRFIVKDGKITQQQTAIKSSDTDILDFAFDKDIYLLYKDRVVKYVSGNAQSFPYPSLSQAIEAAEKIFVAGNNVYILENGNKRLIIMSKNGVLVNQIILPKTSSLTDFYVNESARIINVLDNNKLLEITF